jgi:hypothetical protein
MTMIDWQLRLETCSGYLGGLKVCGRNRASERRRRRSDCNSDSLQRRDLGEFLGHSPNTLEAWQVVPASCLTSTTFPMLPRQLIRELPDRLLMCAWNPFADCHGDLFLAIRASSVDARLGTAASNGSLLSRE